MQLKRLASVGAAEAITKLLSWLSLATLPVFVSAQDYGQIILMFTTVTVLFPFFIMGQDRRILSADGPVVMESVSDSVAIANRLLLLTLAILVLVYFFSDFSAWYMLGIVLAAYFMAINKFLISAYRAKGELLEYIKNRLSYGLSRFTSIVFLVYIFGLAAYILAEIFSAILVSVSAFRGSALNKGFYYYKRLVVSGAPLFFHSISGLVFSFSDRYIIDAYCSKQELASYSLAYTLAASMTFVYAVIAVIYEPLIYKVKGRDGVRSVLKGYFKYCYLGGVTFAPVIFFVYVFLYMRNVSEGYEYLPGVLSILIVAHFVMPLYLAGNYYLVRLGMAHLLLVSTGVAAVLNVVLNFAFVPVYGSVAAAATTLFAFVMAAAVSLYFVRKNDRGSYEKE